MWLCEKYILLFLFHTFIKVTLFLSFNPKTGIYWNLDLKKKKRKKKFSRTKDWWSYASSLDTVAWLRRLPRPEPPKFEGYILLTLMRKCNNKDD